MRTLSGAKQPAGRLYESLPHLARQVHFRLESGFRTVWCDQCGRVFVGDSDRFVPPEAHAIIGRYDSHASQASIERDLRAALRERASTWIVDWNCLPKARVGA